MPKRSVYIVCVLRLMASVTLVTSVGVLSAQAATELSKDPGTVSISQNGSASAMILVETQRVAVKETGPKETVAKFGEVYAFSPTFFVVRQNQPTRILFWNLQPDDLHNFALFGPQSRELVLLPIPALSDQSLVFDFHKPGLYKFLCTIHQPEMNGQILVLPAAPH